MKPILFNSEMVRAILDGQKTQTRRLVKPQPEEIYGQGTAMRMCEDEELKDVWCYYREDPPLYTLMGMYTSPWGDDIVSPYRPGDMLYVRETWKQATGGTAGDDKYLYKADGKTDAEYEAEGLMAEGRWHPSIHMPKAAARIFLRVTNVRAERLQDMSEDDAISEGYSGACPGAHTVHFSDGYAEPCHVSGEDCGYGYWYCDHSIQEAFGRDIWDKTIKPADISSYGWDASPWVWVIEFKRVGKEAADA